MVSLKGMELSQPTRLISIREGGDCQPEGGGNLRLGWHRDRPMRKEKSGGPDPWWLFHLIVPESTPTTAKQALWVLSEGGQGFTHSWAPGKPAMSPRATDGSCCHHMDGYRTKG